MSDDLSYDNIDGVRYIRKAPFFMKCIEKGSGAEFYAKKASTMISSILFLLSRPFGETKGYSLPRLELRCLSALNHDNASQENFQVELGFAYVYHKVQGIIVKNGVILDLNDKAWSKRPELAKLTVAISRAQCLDDIRVLPSMDRPGIDRPGTHLTSGYHRPKFSSGLVFE